MSKKAKNSSRTWVISIQQEIQIWTLKFQFPELQQRHTGAESFWRMKKVRSKTTKSTLDSLSFAKMHHFAEDEGCLPLSNSPLGFQSPPVHQRWTNFPQKKKKETKKRSQPFVLSGSSGSPEDLHLQAEPMKLIGCATRRALPSPGPHLSPPPPEEFIPQEYTGNNPVRPGGGSRASGSTWRIGSPNGLEERGANGRGGPPIRLRTAPLSPNAQPRRKTSRI